MKGGHDDSTSRVEGDDDGSKFNVNQSRLPKVVERDEHINTPPSTPSEGGPFDVESTIMDKKKQSSLVEYSIE
ncbi:hypothetical protein LIER_43667 [Lithospermum erythrorhizon]|uniref:Uncharacterized protein n=1 Tax=Lithospermum erythrorhizon TaxID=34254 RepID=A0AAV3QIM3_LITER